MLETRRRFVRVRTPAGIEGWTDTNLLLTQQQMDDLHKLAQSVAKLPSQGAATVFDALNMHAQASRQSPSFYQIPEKGSVEVIGHSIAPKYPTAAPAAPVHRAAAPKKSAKTKSTKGTPPPPPPVPPGAPKNWEALSQPRASNLPGYIPPAARPNATALEDWSLVRMRDSHADPKTDPKVGWVLSRMLLMSIPDEVAQYAEGHRITAYVALGEVRDKERNAMEPNWLWTTQSSSQVDYEFDSFRVFVWSTRRHRYETAYIERNVKGYYPIEAVPVPGQDEKSFSLVLQDKDGKIYKRTYAFAGYHVHMISKSPYQLAPALPEVRGTHSFDADPVPQPSDSTFGEKLHDLRKRWFGK